MDSELRHQRRISVLCSHLCPPLINARNTQIVSTSNCSSESTTTQLDLAETPNFQKDCVFCQIIRGNSPAFKLYEDDMCLCILDTSPLSRGHSLLIPKCHFCSLDATPPSVIAAMSAKIPFISNAIKKATGCGSYFGIAGSSLLKCHHLKRWFTGCFMLPRMRSSLFIVLAATRVCLFPGHNSFNLLVNNGAAAGQVIFHTHVHIIPRKAHDHLWDSESLRRLSLKLDQEAPHLAASIREHLEPANDEEECKDQGSALAGNCRE